MRFLKPKHTVASVVQMLISGLDDGSIVLDDASWKVFPLSRVLTQLGSIVDKNEVAVSLRRGDAAWGASLIV